MPARVRAVEKERERYREGTSMEMCACAEAETAPLAYVWSCKQSETSLSDRRRLKKPPCMPDSAVSGALPLVDG